MNLIETTNKIVNSMGVNSILRGVWELSQHSNLSTTPCRKQLHLPTEKNYTFVDNSLRELSRLGENELSTVKICANNIKDILYNDLVPMGDKKEIIRGFSSQCVEEMDHAILSFMAIGKIPKAPRFTLYKKSVHLNVSSRILLVLAIEIAEFDIRSVRIAKELMSKKTNQRSLDADRLALVDDISHIKGGALALKVLSKHGLRPDKRKVKAILNSFRTPKEKTEGLIAITGFKEPLRSRLNLDSEILRWITHS